MSNKKPDPLDKLFMKSEEVEGEYRELLANLLQPHVRMDPDTGKIYFTSHPTRLNTKQHVLVYLLAKLALSQKNERFELVSSAKEVEEGTGLPGGTVRPKLRELFGERAISKGDAGYFIEVTSLHKARSLLEDTLPKQS